MKRLLSREEAFTGLEAAIVLIAFVVVAAVFSYVVLGAGFFTTQKSQQVVHQGVQQASSSIEILGNVYGLDMTGTGAEINMVNFTVGLAPGGMPIDMTKVTMVISNQTNRTQLSAESPLYPCLLTAPPTPAPTNSWCIAKITNGNTNTYLESGEQFDIVVTLQDGFSAIAPRDQFTLEVKPIIGPALSIARTAPTAISTVNAIY
ncbi:MAG TPA: archaellin/type IV pilin N-terminal domain-containing protein [Methanomicrobiales archaeon]|nr:archaellin/type IV pilin N-terminal domain-containing protein [Methanomicrobiales archaeon]